MVGLVYTLHNLAGNGIIAVSLVQLIVLFLGRQFKTSWLTAWIGGILLTLSTIALGWTAMILSWTELGFWRLKVELSIIGSVPLVGETLQNFLTGGGGINTSTVTRFYTLHGYVLSVACDRLFYNSSICISHSGGKAKKLASKAAKAIISFNRA